MNSDRIIKVNEENIRINFSLSIILCIFMQSLLLLPYFRSMNRFDF